MNRYIFFIRRKIWRLFNKHSFKSIGKKSFIQNPLLLHYKKNIVIGNKVFIRDNARIETINFWGNITYHPLIIIGDNVNIEQGFHMTCANKIQIEEGCVFSSYVMITDIDHSYSNISERILAQKLIVNETIIERNCFVGCGAKIMAGVHLGEHCIVGANSVVTKSFPSYCVLVGIPAKCIKRYNDKTQEWEKTLENGNFLNN